MGGGQRERREKGRECEGKRGVRVARVRREKGEIEKE